MEVAANFPDQCGYVLEMLGQVYGHEAETRERGLRPEERLQFHQERSTFAGSCLLTLPFFDWAAAASVR